MKPQHMVDPYMRRVIITLARERSVYLAMQTWDEEALEDKLRSGAELYESDIVLLAELRHEKRCMTRAFTRALDLVRFG